MSGIRQLLLSSLGLMTLVLCLSTPVSANSIDCGGASTGTQVCAATKVVVGQDLSIFSFDVELPGEYSLSLIDYEWPDSSLAALNLSLSTATTTLASLDAAGSLLFFAAPGTYFAQVYGQADLTSGIGLYGLMVDGVAVIPLPSALILLLSALALMLPIARSRRDEKSALLAAPA